MFDSASSRQHIVGYFVAYLNSGSALSASFVPPGSITLLPAIWRLPNGTTTSRSPMPRKPPTDSTANRTLSLGSTRRSSTSPIFSLASLTTGLPTIFGERYPAASFWTSTRSITDLRRALRPDRSREQNCADHRCASDQRCSFHDCFLLSVA